MSRASFFRQRLPCAGLFFWAAIGVVLGRFVPLSGWVYAALGAAALLAAFRRSAALPVGVALAFAAAQTWQYRESPAAALARGLDGTPRVCQAVIEVLEAPRASALAPDGCAFTARLETVAAPGLAPAAPCRVVVRWNGDPPVYGGRYEVRASISNCPPPRNPGAFDYAAWLANAGIRSQLDVPSSREATLLGVGGNPVVRFALASRDWVSRTISLGIDGTPEAILIRAMTLGETSDAPDSLKDAFRETGTFHLFSVSGLHVGIVAVILWTLLGAGGASPRWSVLVVVPALFFYVLVTGLSPASVRAAIMLSVVAAGRLLDRPAVALNGIGAAGLLILAGDSSQLFNSGFQLSFGAVTAIILFARPLGRRMEALVAPDPFVPKSLRSRARRAAESAAGGAAALVAVSLAAWVVSLPLIVYYFHLVSFASIPANLFAVPLSGLVLGLAAVSLGAGAISPWLAGVFNQANFLLTKILLLLVQAIASLPGAAVYVGPAPGTVAALTVLDAGAGGAAVFRTGAKTWAVDAGPAYFADAVLLPFLRRQGVNRLDALALTHGDGRHVGGAARLAEALRPREVLDSGRAARSPARRRLLEAWAGAGVEVVAADAGRDFVLDASTRITVLYPPRGREADLADDEAVVLRLAAGGFSALLVSDAGLATEQWLLAHAPAQLRCDLLVMGRHVSGFSGDAEFLRVARPRAVIATAADFPRAENIRPDWARAVDALGIALFRQDETGAVRVTIQRDGFVVAPFLPAGGPARTFSFFHDADSLR